MFFQETYIIGYKDYYLRYKSLNSKYQYSHSLKKNQIQKELCLQNYLWKKF